MPKFSIVIPTRARADTLLFALRTAVEQSFCDIEILVHESGDDPRTAEVVAQWGDGRTRHLKTGRPVSMTENWERALSSSTGEYIMFLGDDDGLTTDACAVASSILDRNPAELLSWRPPAYYWPLYVCEPQRNRLLGVVGNANVIERKSSALILELFYRFREDYSRLPMIYNSFVKQSLIDRVRNKLGRYFVYAAPDVCSGIVNSFCSQDYLLSSRPLSVSGLSHHSTGHRLYFGKDRGQREEAARGAFDDLQIHPTLVRSNNLKLFIGNEMLMVKEALFPDEGPAFSVVDLLYAASQALESGPDDYDESLADIGKVAALNGIRLDDFIVPSRRRAASMPPQGVRPLGEQALLIDVNCAVAGIADVRDAARFLQALLPPPGEQATAGERDPMRTLPPITSERLRVDFSQSGSGALFLGVGWGEVEPWGTWTIGRRADVRMRIEGHPEGLVQIVISGHMFVFEGMPNSSGSVRVNGGPVTPFTASLHQPNVAIHLVGMPAEMIRGREIVLEFEIDRPVSPVELGISPDTRRLGFGLKAIEIATRRAEDGR